MRDARRNWLGVVFLPRWRIPADNLVERSIDGVWTFISLDLAGHIDEALKLLGIIRWWLWLAWHGSIPFSKLLADPREKNDRCIQTFNRERGIPVIPKCIYGYDPKGYCRCQMKPVIRQPVYHVSLSDGLMRCCIRWPAW